MKIALGSYNLYEKSLINFFHYSRFASALEEAQTVDRIVGTLGEKALEALANESPFLGKQLKEISKLVSK